LAAALAAAPGTLAQEITGTITGTVADQTGGVLPGVTVTVRNTGTGLTREVQTGAEGGYNVPLLPVGRYEVTFALAGSRPRPPRTYSSTSTTASSWT
jgi:hypothetical protein